MTELMLGFGVRPATGRKRPGERRAKKVEKEMERSPAEAWFFMYERLGGSTSAAACRVGTIPKMGLWRSGGCCDTLMRALTRQTRQPRRDGNEQLK